MIRSAALGACLLATGCASRQAVRTSESIFGSPAAEIAQQLAPDLYEEAKLAAAQAEQAQRDKDDQAADDYRTESRLWLVAAIAEADRIQIDQRRADLEREEERWSKQLARDQDASAEVAGDISRFQAKVIALQEAQRVEALSEGRLPSAAVIEALITRIRLNLALADAFGAPEQEVGRLRDRAEALARQGEESGRSAEALLRQTEDLIGRTRAHFPVPRPGATIELVQSASASGFSADHSATGVIVRSQEFFGADGNVSRAKLKRFSALLAAFPHGPVGCQVAVPNDHSRVWERRVAQLAAGFGRIDTKRRVSTSMFVTQSLDAGTVQCTFAAYQDP